MAKCWKCAEEIKDEAFVCRYCQAAQHARARRSHILDRVGLDDKRGIPIWLAIPVLILGWSAFSCTPTTPSDPGAEAAGPSPEYLAQQAERERTGEHCLSAWDGSAPTFVALVEQGLNDPDSFDHRTTWIEPVDADGNHRIKMVFGARNGFGGMVVAEATGTVRQGDCSAVLDQVTPLGS